MGEVSEVLKSVLSNTYILFLMSQNYHWNLKGRDFYPLHKLFESHYEDMFQAIDEIAERIAGLGTIVPGSFEEFTNFSELQITTGDLNAEAMLTNLKESHQKLITIIEKGLDVAGEQGDEASFDILVQRLKTHNKMLWMISKSLE